MYDIGCPNVTKTYCTKLLTVGLPLLAESLYLPVEVGEGPRGRAGGPVQRGVPDHRHTRVEEVQVTPGLPGGLQDTKHWLHDTEKFITIKNN